MTGVLGRWAFSYERGTALLFLRGAETAVRVGVVDRGWKGVNGSKGGGSGCVRGRGFVCESVLGPFGGVREGF